MWGDLEELKIDEHEIGKLVGFIRDLGSQECGCRPRPDNGGGRAISKDARGYLTLILQMDPGSAELPAGSGWHKAGTKLAQSWRNVRGKLAASWRLSYSADEMFLLLGLSYWKQNPASLHL